MLTMDVDELEPRFDWCWDEKSVQGTMQLSSMNRVVTFPTASSSTVAVVGNRPFKPGYLYYWELMFTKKVYGTDTMIGVGTKRAHRTHEDYCSLLGMDKESWGYSYRGYKHHNGEKEEYSNNFLANEVIGVLLDTFHGTLEFFKNGEPLGVAFRNIERLDDLYPMVSSTAARSCVHLKYCANVRSSLKIQAFAKLCQTEGALEFIRLVPGLRNLFMDSWWLLNRDREQAGHNLTSGRFCWQHASSTCQCIYILELLQYHAMLFQDGVTISGPELLIPNVDDGWMVPFH